MKNVCYGKNLNGLFLANPIVKRTRMKWETMSTLNVYLTNQLAHTLDKAPKRKTTKILNFQLWQMKVAIQNQNFLLSAIIAMSQDTRKDTVTNLSTSDTFSLLTSPSSVLTSKDRTPRNYRAFFPILLLFSSEKPLFRV